MDLLCYHENYGSYVLVQYKRMLLIHTSSMVKLCKTERVNNDSTD